MGRAKELRDEAKRLAKLAVMAYTEVNPVKGEALWEKAKEFAIYSVSSQAYQNGIREGKRLARAKRSRARQR